MKNDNRISDHLEELDDDFYGRLVIRIKEGRAVMITVERDTRLDKIDEEERGTRK